MVQIWGSTSSRQQAVPQGQVPPVVASLTVEALTPEVAARAANLWAEAVTRRVNRIPLARLGANLEALEEQIAPAERAYREIQARWEAFQRASTLAQDKAELDAKTGEWVSLDQALSGLEQDLAGVAGRVRVLQAKESQQAAFVPAATNPEQLAMIGRKLRNAQLNLKQEVDRAQQSYVQAAKRLEAYRKNERLAEWQGEQDRLTQRFSEIALRLAQISTEVQVRQARLHEVDTVLAQEPKLLQVLRVVVSDPVMATAVAKGDLSALLGLRLRTEEINPSYQPLLSQAVALQMDLQGLQAEVTALGDEREREASRLEVLHAQIAAQEREKETVLLDYGTRKAAYEAFRSRYDQIVNLNTENLTFDNPNPEYQRLRSALFDAQVEEAKLLSRRAALQARIAQVETRIALLRERVAKAQVEQDRLSQALELDKNAYLALSQKKTDLQIELASSHNSLAQVIAPAYPVYEKVASKRGLVFVLAVSLGLVLGVMVAFVAEALRAEGRIQAA